MENAIHAGLILLNMITGFVAGSETIDDNVGGGAIVTREGTGICVFVGADFAGNISEYNIVLIVLRRCSFKELFILIAGFVAGK